MVQTGFTYTEVANNRFLIIKGVSCQNNLSIRVRKAIGFKANVIIYPIVALESEQQNLIIKKVLSNLIFIFLPW